MKTPTNRRSQSDTAELEKSSGKKLVQAKLPFKILTTPEGIETGKEARKRKLSCEEEETETLTTPQSTKRRSLRGGRNEGSIAKKRKDVINGSAAKKPVTASVVLSDSSDSDGNNEDIDADAENVKITKEQHKLANVGESDMLSDDAELIDSEDDNETKITKNSKTEPPKKMKATEKTPVTKKKPTPKNSKKSVTPQSAKKSNGRGRKSSGEANSASKLQIKLNINTKKNKRRKQPAKAPNAEADDAQDETSDDVEIISELHPEKRAKLDIAKDDGNNERGKKQKVENEVIEKEATGQEKELEKVNFEEKEQPKKDEIEENPSETESKLKDETSISPKDRTEKNIDSEETVSESEQNKSKIHEVSSTISDLEADSEETETTGSKSFKKKSEEVLRDSSTNENSNISKNNTDSKEHNIQKKNLTPKQQKLMQQRLKAREEKERKIQEERLQKQREKEERELAKKREREEKEEQRRKEREEKEEHRRKEREEKERKRLAEIEVKNEEKRKRIEAKEEEQRKKEEERKRKEQEKEEERKRKEQENEEAELKKKKAALAFTKFFSRPAQDNGQYAREQDITEENHESLAFRPFQIKDAMTLAPIVRKKLTNEGRNHLAAFIKGESSEKTYLEELKSGAIKPYKWSPSPDGENYDAVNSKQEKNDSEDDDVVLIDSQEDGLERAGQAIIEEHIVPIERFRAKFYKFAENRRPPYFGTWRKKSKCITPRRPFALDKEFFDYEVDSDDEWEEEEPGESLDGSDDDKEKESEDEDYEVDNEWFVPHGHLSEEEMQNEDDLSENNDREAQKAKLQLLQQEFVQEMKKKTEKIKPRLIGCIWVDENGNQPELCPKIIWDTLNMRAILCADPPIMEEIKSNTENNTEMNTGNAQNGEKINNEVKLKPITLSESMLKELVRLVHGNTHSKNFLIKEFIAYIEANEESVRNGDVRGPLKSAVREKIEEFAQWQIVEKIKNNHANGSIKDKNTKAQKNKKKLCWVVSKDILQKMNLGTINTDNNWEYILQPKFRHKTPEKEENSAEVTTVNDEKSDEQCETNVPTVNNGNDPTTPIHQKKKQNLNIKKVLTAEEKAQQLHRKSENAKTISKNETAIANSGVTKSTPKRNVITPISNTNQTPTVKKRVPLLISVARGQSISTPVKNARISQFLKTINDDKEKEKQTNNVKTSPIKTDNIVVLD